MVPSVVSWLHGEKSYGAVTSFLAAQRDVMLQLLVSWLLRVMSYDAVTSFTAAQSDAI